MDVNSCRRATYEFGSPENNNIWACDAGDGRAESEIAALAAATHALVQQLAARARRSSDSTGSVHNFLAPTQATHHLRDILI